MPAYRPGVARCSLWSQTFVHPFLQYSGHYTSLERTILASLTTFSFLCDLSKIYKSNDRHFLIFRNLFWKIAFRTILPAREKLTASVVIGLILVCFFVPLFLHFSNTNQTHCTSDETFIIQTSESRNFSINMESLGTTYFVFMACQLYVLLLAFTFSTNSKQVNKLILNSKF